MAGLKIRHTVLTQDKRYIVAYYDCFGSWSSIQYVRGFEVAFKNKGNVQRDDKKNGGRLW